MKVCKIEECNNSQRKLTRGWCAKHYARWLRHGDPYFYKPKVAWNKGKKGVQIGVNKGKTFSEETRKKLSDSHKGHHPKNAFRKGDIRITGKNSHFWKGGITPINEKIRKSMEYKMWRKDVFERDNYACVQCKQVGGVLHADHIKPFALYPELRFELSNGRTLCISCHRETDTYGWKGALWS